MYIIHSYIKKNPKHFKLNCKDLFRILRFFLRSTYRVTTAAERDRSTSLTQKWQQYGVIVGHDKQVDAVQGRAGLEVAKRLAQIAVLGTVAHKHLKSIGHQGGKSAVTLRGRSNSHRGRRTCQQVCGDFLSKMYCVSGDGSSSYLSKGTLSITMGSASRQENRTCGWAERGGWMEAQRTEI